jgi:serine/threonine protein kinase
MSTRDEIVALIKAAGKYELRDESNEGMNAYAFFAHHRPLDKPVFLKVYDADTESAEIFREPRFLVEATRAGDRSQNLVEVYDAEMLGQEFVLVSMEYVDGGSILGRLQSGPMRLMDAIATTIGILHGVAQLHAACLVHRDIKPANVLLARRGNIYVPKLGDFGSVARLSSPNATVTASRHSALYVPPEGWIQECAYGTRSDLYQVGMVLHELANGPLPYDFAAHLDREARAELKGMGLLRLSDLDQCDACLLVNRAISRRASNSKLLSLRPSQPYEPRALSRIIRKATAPSIEDRYQTASEFIGALEALSFPNWEPADVDCIEARGWRNWDWRIEPNGGDVVVIRRARKDSGNYRKWDSAEGLEKAARLVSEVS